MMVFQLSDLLTGLCSVTKTDDVMVCDIGLDSRLLQKQSLFFALARDRQQRINHISQALKSDCAAIVYDDDVNLSLDEIDLIHAYQIPAVAVINLSQHVSDIAARFYGHPSRDLNIIAVTGTNGKTSVSQFIAQALEYLGLPCATIGTLGVGRLGDEVSTNMTTPDPVTIQKVLADFKAQGIKYVALEASSHALDQGRLNSVAIDVAIFTNLTRDHLDYHGDMQQYAAAKQRLFELPSLNKAVLNRCDPFGQALYTLLNTNPAISVQTYSSQPLLDADITARDSKTNLSGLQFTLEYQHYKHCVSSPLLGRFNIDNVIAAFAGLVAAGIDSALALKAVKQCKPVAGRMEAYSADGYPLVVVDFAHTPSALIDVLTSLRGHVSKAGKLWCVFGCGGDRDKGKRPLMGEAAQAYADCVVVTSDNPRSEASTDIINDVLAGITIAQENSVHIEDDRAGAIHYAMMHASLNDIVLIAGKGHEQYQEIRGVKYPFSDVAVVKQILASPINSEDKK